MCALINVLRRLLNKMYIGWINSYQDLGGGDSYLVPLTCEARGKF